MTGILQICLVISLLALLALVRFLILVRKNARSEYSFVKRTKACRTLIVVGSGGHTSEMMKIMSGLNLRNYTPRTYIIASGDNMSQDKINRFEGSSKQSSAMYAIKDIPRARKVLQSYFTTIFTTLKAIVNSFSLVFSFGPDLVLCNGPGTCIPICGVAFLLKYFSLRDTKIVYVESLCRVKRLSLSGLLLYYLYLADHIFVQWPLLKKLYPRTKYIGKVV